MKLLRYRLLLAIVLICAILLPISLIAQPDPCGDPMDPGWLECTCAYNPSNPVCPIDGGVVALLAAGVGYGIKKARDARRKAI